MGQNTGILMELKKKKFGENVGDKMEFQETIRYRALASRVLAVATTRVEGTWVAYCDAVEGWEHRQEFHEVLRSGDKLPVGIAKSIFPEFQDMPYSE